MITNLNATVYSVFDGDYPSGITVEWRDIDSWAVMNGSRVLSTDGSWDFEPLPSSRTEAWKVDHRFTLYEAFDEVSKLVDK